MIRTGNILVLFSIERMTCVFSLFSSVSPRKSYSTLWNDAINTSFTSFPIHHLQLSISVHSMQAMQLRKHHEIDSETTWISG
jgi:hypothetical protein